MGSNLEYHLLTLVCQCAIMTLADLFLWSNVSTFIQKSRPKIPEVHLPEDPFLQIAAGLRIEINMALAFLREIASGHDLKKFPAVIVGTIHCKSLVKFLGLVLHSLRVDTHCSRALCEI